MISLYRCAACGSPRVVATTQKEGFSYVKGAVGTAVFGAAGAVAGLDGKKTQVFKCPDCGLELDHPMSQEIAMLIDMGVTNLRARENLMFRGEPLPWKVLTDKYKNIEKGAADEEEQRIADKKEGIFAASNTATREQFDEAFETILKYEERLGIHRSPNAPIGEDEFTLENPISLAEYRVWQNAIAMFIENAASYLPQSLPSTSLDNRQISTRMLCGYLVSYCNDKITEEYSVFPFDLRVGAKDNSESLYEFVLSSHPYIRELIDRYRDEMNSSKSFPIWIMKGLNERRTAKLLDLDLTNESGDQTIGRIRCQIPFFIIINGRFGYWDAAFESSPLARYTTHSSELIDHYFQHFPEKRRPYYDKINAYMQSIDYNKYTQNKIDQIQTEIRRLKKDISEEEEEIVRLSSKWFGKKKAQEEIARFRQIISQQNNQIAQKLSEIDVAKKGFKVIPDADSFVKELAEENDYFIAWHWTV